MRYTHTHFLSLQAISKLYVRLHCVRNFIGIDLITLSLVEFKILV